MNELVVKSLSKTVPDADRELTILDAVSFRVREGDSVAIVGASGSGKSTLLGLLAGLDRPSAGTVEVDGQDLFAWDEDGRARWRAQRLGFVFQSFLLLPQFTAIENVMLPMELGSGASRAGDRFAPKGSGDAGRASQDPRTRAMELLARVGLGDRAHHYPRTLSGGEQQRVAIARAFAASPAWLLADEPTGSLDHATGERIADLLFEMNAESGATLILVTHDVELASRCTRQLRIDTGKLVSDSGASSTAAPASSVTGANAACA